MNEFAPNSPEARDIAHHLHPYTSPAMLREKGPHIMNSGSGIYVTDNDGQEFIEGMSGLWCVSLGWNEQELIKAATDQMQKLPYYHSFAGKTVNPAVDLAEKLIQIAPDGLSKVFFNNSGSEANDTAIKMVWYYHAAIGKPEKKKIISRQRGYHGVTLAAASLTALPYVQNGFGLPLDFALHTSSPHYFQDAHDGESEAEFTARIMRELEDMIEAEGADTIGAFIAEPLMGAGGVIMPPEGYFEALQPILKKHDILLIADEVICGFGRTGSMWGSQSMDVQPDMLTCAKALSSAYLPISAVIMSNRVYDMLASQAEELGIFGHGYTYSAHPVCAAVALRAQQLMQERGIVDKVAVQAPRFAAHVARMDRFSFIGNTRSIGLIGAMEFSADPESRNKFDPHHKIAAQAVAKIQENGVILRALPGDIIGFCPPLVISDDEMDDMFARVETALADFETTASALR
ncbi:MAG TPA: aspartate aminotransferase family protein [Alphaproteobacteria bacterium]|nr:aspartate aminotransferase family protein [Alphaproteobacteria bacterium]